jgi:hypothetical protein
MTLGSYAHVIRELKGEPVVSAEEQVERPAGNCRDAFGTLVLRRPMAPSSGIGAVAGDDGETRTRTGDTTIFRRGTLSV